MREVASNWRSIMQIPLQITFRNIPASLVVQEWIQAEAQKLENFYHPIIGCRVALGVPHKHSRKGFQYGVRIDLTLPGGEVVVKHQSDLRSRAFQEGIGEMPKKLEVGIPHKNLRLAIDDAFRVAGRRLQDYARKQSGRVKTHEAVPMARVSRIMSDEGYGFLVAEDGREIYFHREAACWNRGFPRLRIGTLVTFTEEQGEKGAQASTVRIAGKHSLRRAVASGSLA